MECLKVPEVSYAEFSQGIQHKLRVNRIPVVGGIEPTFRCNLKCVHCYVDCNKDKDRELSTEEIFRIFDEIADAGCLWLLITGGDPLLREDFLDIYTYAKKKGFIITIFTNGTLITPEIADYLKQWPPYKVEITMNGATKQTYEAVTRVAGSFEKFLSGVHLLLERKIPLVLKCTVTTLNKDELWKVKEFVEELGLGKYFRFDAILNPKLDGSKEVCELRLTPEEIVSLDLVNETRVQGFKRILERSENNPVSSYLYTCGAGLTSFHISPYGELCLCLLSRQPNYDLRKGTFIKGWSEFLPKMRSQEIKVNYSCWRCNLRDLCGKCPGWAQLENKNPEKPVKFLCEIAHVRKEMLERVA